MDRLAANREIMNLIWDAVERYPSMRFTQLLYSLDIVKENRGADGCVVSWQTEYNTESVETLSRVRQALAAIQAQEVKVAGFRRKR